MGAHSGGGGRVPTASVDPASTPGPEGNNLFDQDQLAEIPGGRSPSIPFYSTVGRAASAVSRPFNGAAGAAMSPVSGRGGPASNQMQMSPGVSSAGYGGHRGSGGYGAVPSPATLVHHLRPSSTVPMTSGFPAVSGRGIPPRIDFFRNCGAVVEERDPNSGRVVGSYRCGALLGTGGFAKVFDFTDCVTGERVACKIIEKAKLTDASKQAKLAAEIQVHQRMTHPNILRFIRHFQDEYYHFILLERCCKQSLMELSRSRGRFALEECQFIMVQLLQAVEYMHQHCVIHRDLKLGNVMIDSSGNMKIGDFGFATVLRTYDEKKRTMCGTPNYIAPEILTANQPHHTGYSFEADIWSLGVILYTLVVGIPPFETSDLQTTYTRIKRCEYSFPPTCRVSDACRDLISWMLQREPKMRPQLVQIRNHAFLRLPEAPRVAPMSLVGLDGEIAALRDAPSPYTEAGRSSSPIQDTAGEAGGSPLAHAPAGSFAVQQAPPSTSVQYTGAAVELTPPPAYNGPQPTPYFFNATPQRALAAATEAATPKHQSVGVARPLQLYTPSAEDVITTPNRPTTTEDRDAIRETFPTASKGGSQPSQKQQPQQQGSSTTTALPAEAEPISTTTSTNTTSTEADDADGCVLHDTSTSSTSSADVLERHQEATPSSNLLSLSREPAPAATTRPQAPRVFFSDMVHFPRYGHGFQLWDQRAQRGTRTKSTAAYFNDKSKLVRDINNDATWYLARVRDDSQTPASGPSPLVSDDLAPRCFYDQLHHFASGSAALDPKNSSPESSLPFVQAQHVFKKYTIVKFIETHFAAINNGATSPFRDESPSITSSFRDLMMLEPHEDVFHREPLPTYGDAGDLTFVKEAILVPAATLLSSCHASIASNGGTVAQMLNHPLRMPMVAAARFSDLSFQVTLSFTCPSPLQFSPQMVGVKATSPVSHWRLDVMFYDSRRLAVIFRADEDMYAISMSDVSLQKRRGFGGNIVFTATAGYPRALTAIMVPESTLNIVVEALRRIHCPEDLAMMLTVASVL